MTEHRTNSTQKQRISSFEPGTMFLGTILAVLSAIVCMQILGKVGVSANTSILGAIFAMLVSATSKVNTTPTNFLERRLLSAWSLAHRNLANFHSQSKNKATSGCPLLYVLQALKGSALYLRGDLSLLVLKIGLPELTNEEICEAAIRYAKLPEPPFVITYKAPNRPHNHK